MLRHPGIVKVLDTVEVCYSEHREIYSCLISVRQTDTYIYIAIERVSPLSWQTKRKAMSATSIVWGLHTLAVRQLVRYANLDLTNSQKTLSFINTEASSVHGNVRLSSIFITESGEWKLAGVELLSSMQEDDAIIYVSLRCSVTDNSILTNISRTHRLYRTLRGTWPRKWKKEAGIA